MDWKNINHQCIDLYIRVCILGVVFINFISFLIPSLPKWINFWISVILFALAVVFFSIRLIIIRNENKLHFAIIGKFRKPFRVTDNEPVDGDWSILIHSPNRPVKGCRILLNNKELSWWDTKEFNAKRDINLGGGGIVRISRNEFPEDIIWHAEGKIMEGKKTGCVFRFARLKDLYERVYGT